MELFIRRYIYVFPMQFLGRKHKDLTPGLIQNASIGQKDAQRSLYSLWKEVFQLPTVGRK